MPTQRAANAALHERLNVENLIGVARLIHTAAVLRKESRGSHFREDFPDTDPEYRVNIVLQRKSDGAIGYEVRPVNFSRRTPGQLEGDIVIPQEQAAPEAQR
jgi:succinate dehydrogenase/fumarate reductase flavoprotein subunit